jgi:hypothetical protein
MSADQISEKDFSESESSEKSEKHVDVSSKETLKPKVKLKVFLHHSANSKKGNSKTRKKMRKVKKKQLSKQQILIRNNLISPMLKSKLNTSKNIVEDCLMSRTCGRSQKGI